MTGSERSSPEPLLKKEASPAEVHWGENSGNALAPTLEENSRKSSESVSGIFGNVSGISSGKSQPYWGCGLKTGRFGSLAFAMKNRHSGGESSRILAGKARTCGRFWTFVRVSQIVVNNVSADSALQALGNKAEKKCQIVPLPMCFPPPLPWGSTQAQICGQKICGHLDFLVVKDLQCTN